LSGHASFSFQVSVSNVLLFYQSISAILPGQNKINIFS
jgi:hypothetical protein